MLSFKKWMLLGTVLLCSALVIDPAWGIGRGGGGGGGRGGGGGGMRGGGGGGGGAMRGGGGGGGRPAMGGNRPSPSTGNRPNMGARPGGGMSRPNISAPSYGGGRPQGRPNGNAPSMNRPNMSRPNANRPNNSMPNRPGGGYPSTGGLRPSTRPSMPGGGTNISGNRPNINPGGMNRPNYNRPNISVPGIGSTGPTTRPGMNRPDGNRPNVRPGGDRPTTLPGQIGGGNRPGLERPTTRPGTLPGTLPGAGNRPPIANRPGGNQPGVNRPGVGDRPGIGNRPGAGDRPGIARPLPGDLNDFLGIQRPNRPGSGGATTLPGQIGGNRPNLPNRPGNRPERPVTLPGDINNRPGIRPDRPVTLPGDINNRPDWIGNRPNRPNRPNLPGDGGLNRPPNWANRPGSININNNWNNSFNRPWISGDQWLNRHPDRRYRWNDWGNRVRYNWGWGNSGCFGPSWWHNHPHRVYGWHYHNWNHNNGWNYWWTVPTYAGLTNWFTWSAPQQVWQQPVYYDYGQGGNVYYDNDTVYVNEQPVGNAEDFAASAATLATVQPPENDEAAQAAEWMPLGTFAVSSSEKDFETGRVIQLAVSREGVVSGTAFSETADVAQTVLGQVDKETQRVAFRIGDKEDIIFETGIYNLTQDEVPVMVHFGMEKVEYWLLVRLKAPEEEEQQYGQQ